MTARRIAQRFALAALAIFLGVLAWDTLKRDYVAVTRVAPRTTTHPHTR